jgi:hypothetical protein
MHPWGVFASSGRNAFVQGELAFMCFGALCRLILLVLFCRWCRALLPHLEESTILEHFISVVVDIANVID